MHDLKASDYDKIWVNSEAERADIALRQRYYDGKHAISFREEDYVDGTRKTNLVTNYIKYGVDLYTGSIVGTPVNVTALEGIVDPDDPDAVEVVNESPAVYRDIATENNLGSADVESLRSALISGWGINLHERADDRDIITSQDPVNWKPVYNSDSVLIGAIFRAVLPAGSFVGDDMIENETDVMVVYTDSEIISFERKHKGNDKKKDEFEETDRVQHFFGVPPIVIFQLNESMTPLITDDLIAQNDEYNDIDSISGDEIRNSSDGVLVIKGYSQTDITDNADKIREWKILPIATDGDATYLEKPTDFERNTSRLDRTRQHIFTIMAVPDINEITGATGSTSGIALQLKFKPMRDNAQYMITNFRAGIRSRLDLINVMASKATDSQAIEDVQINIKFDLPANRVEEWKSIGAVSGIVSKRKQLEMLSDVEDPDQEESRLAKDAEDGRFIDRTSGTPEEIMAQNDAEISANAILLEPQVASMIDSISDAVLTETLRRQ